MDGFFELASDNVIWEKIGNQIVIADLSSGQYCNIESGSGVLIWECLINSLSFQEILKIAAKTYSNWQPEFTMQISAFLSLLISTQIIKTTPLPTPSKGAFLPETLNKHFTEPKILMYGDLDTLLQLDPIDDEIAVLLKESA